MIFTTPLRMLYLKKISTEEQIPQKLGKTYINKIQPLIKTEAKTQPKIERFRLQKLSDYIAKAI